MVPYYIFFMFFGLVAFLDYIKQEDYHLKILKKLSLYIGFILILLFVGFRYKLGSDWVSYLFMYENAIPINQLFSGDNLTFSSDFTEPGFKILVSLCKEMGLNYAYFIFFVTSFNTISLFYFLYSSRIRKKLVFLSIILILTTFYEFDILRQSIAFHIVLFAFSRDKIKITKLILLTLLAITFHYTAIIFIIFYFFQKINITARKISFVSIVYIVSMFMSLPVITSSLKLIEPFVSGTIASILIKAATLIEGFGFQRNISFTSLLNVSFLILLANRVNKIKLSAIEDKLMKMFLFYIIINVFFKEIQEVADRFSYYFNFGIASMFCLLDELIRVRERNMMLIMVPVLFIVMRLTIHFKDLGIWYGQTPYRNYFFVGESDEQLIKNRYDMMQSIKSKEYEGKKD